MLDDIVHGDQAVTNAIRETFKRNLYYAEILKGTTE